MDEDQFKGWSIAPSREFSQSSSTYDVPFVKKMGQNLHQPTQPALQNSPYYTETQRATVPKPLKLLEPQKSKSSLFKDKERQKTLSESARTEIQYFPPLQESMKVSFSKKQNSQKRLILSPTQLKMASQVQPLPEMSPKEQPIPQQTIPILSMSNLPSPLVDSQNLSVTTNPRIYTSSRIKNTTLKMTTLKAKTERAPLVISPEPPQPSIYTTQIFKETLSVVDVNNQNYYLPSLYKPNNVRVLISQILDIKTEREKRQKSKKVLL